MEKGTEPGWPGSRVTESIDRDLNESQPHEHCPKPELTLTLPLTLTLTLTQAQSLQAFFSCQSLSGYVIGRGKTEASSWGEWSMATWDTEQGKNKLITYLQRWLSWA